MGVSDVKNTIARVTVDRNLDLNDAKEVIASAGKKMSDGEQQAMVTDLVEGMQSDKFEINQDALVFLVDNLQEVSKLKEAVGRQNGMVEQREPLLEGQEKARLEVGTRTESFGGTEIPAAVKEALNTALAAGAEPYDVAQLREPEKDGDSWKVEGLFTPYPQDIRASGSMSWENTEITPDKLKADMETEQTFNQYTGVRREQYTDPRTGESNDLEIAEYREVRAKGTGNVTSHYDHASHSDTYARGPSGQKWANNYAILSDGSLHALPAMRRTEDQRGLILTNPSLARGQRMLFNGHIEIRGGKVTSIGMSGRLQKLAAKGDHKFANPIPILKAWGFEIDPNIQIRFEGSGGRPEVDDAKGTIG